MSRLIKAEAAVSRFLVRHPKVSQFIAHIPGVSRFMTRPPVATVEQIAPVYNVLARKPRRPTFRL